MRAARKPSGWQRDPARHALAARGVRTGRRPKPIYHITTKRNVERIVAERALVGAENEYPWSEDDQGADKKRDLTISFTTDPEAITEVAHTFAGDSDELYALQFDLADIKALGARPVRYVCREENERPRGLFAEYDEWDVEHEWRIAGKKRVPLPRQFKVRRLKSTHN